jgi:hypothetical protein
MSKYASDSSGDNPMILHKNQTQVKRASAVATLSAIPYTPPAFINGIFHVADKEGILCVDEKAVLLHVCLQIHVVFVPNGRDSLQRTILEQRPAPKTPGLPSIP